MNSAHEAGYGYIDCMIAFGAVDILLVVRVSNPLENTNVFPFVYVFFDFFQPAFLNFTSLDKLFHIFYILNLSMSFHFSFTNVFLEHRLFSKKSTVLISFSIYQKISPVFTDINLASNMIDFSLIFYELSFCFIKDIRRIIKCIFSLLGVNEKAINCIIQPYDIQENVTMETGKKQWFRES